MTQDIEDISYNKTKGYRETLSQDAGYPGGWVKCPNLGAENV